jgi:hypothetical protein
MCGALLAVLCSGCAPADGTSGGTSGNNGSGSGSQAASGGSLSAVCADQANPAAEGSSAADEAKFVAWWNSVAADAPSPIRDKATTVDEAVKKLAAGDASGFSSDTVQQDLADVGTWLIKNCPS